MSGLGVIFQRDGAPVLRSSSERMGNALRLYGPHRQNMRVQGSFAQCWSHLGGFTPEHAFEAQPVVAGNVSLIFSGFLTERPELAEALAVEFDYSEAHVTVNCGGRLKAERLSCEGL